MSATLKQFLHEQAAKNQIGKAEIEEWRLAIERLFGQIRAWLKEADPDGVMEIEQAQQVVNEPGLGHYRVPRLNLRVLGKWIGIISKARRTVGTATPPRRDLFVAASLQACRGVNRQAWRLAATKYAAWPR